MKTFFIADTHFGDHNIMLFESRPFKSVMSMNNKIVENWNKVVSIEDVVYHLGDVSSADYHLGLINRLNGTKYLVKGNHDILSNEAYREAGFREVYDHPIVINGFWMLSHEPMYTNESSPYANIFGHVHNNPSFKDFSNRSFCCCVERIDYTPILFEEIESKMKSQEYWLK